MGDFQESGEGIPVEVNEHPAGWVPAGEAEPSNDAETNSTERSDESGDSLDTLVRTAFDLLPTQVAVLDGEGTIRHTNRTWAAFGEANDLEGPVDRVGVNYLEVCDGSDDEHADRAAAGIRSVLEGDGGPFSMEYPCHAPDELRWFAMWARGFDRDGERYAVVVHLDVTARKLSELAVERRNAELEAVNRIGELVREVVASLGRATTRSEVERSVCERLTTDGAYAAAAVVDPTPTDDRFTVRERSVADDSDDAPDADHVDARTAAVVRAALDAGLDRRRPRPRDRGRAAPPPRGRLRRPRRDGPTPGRLRRARGRRLRRSRGERRLRRPRRRDRAVPPRRRDARAPLPTPRGRPAVFLLSRRRGRRGRVQRRRSRGRRGRGRVRQRPRRPGCGGRVAGGRPRRRRIRPGDRRRGRRGAGAPGVPVPAAVAGPRRRRGWGRGPILHLRDGGVLVAEVDDSATMRAVVDAVAGDADLVGKHGRSRSDDGSRGGDAALDAGLTDRQRDALVAAHRGGYYEWPSRDSNAEELAAAMDVAPQTFHEHLRRAEAKVVDRFVEDGLARRATDPE